MRLAALALLCLALAAPAVAGSGKPAAARLTLCDTAEHSVTFTGDMRRLSRATTLLQMRFTLQTRVAGRRWARVAAPTFDAWLSSAIGKRRYVYDKTVAIPPSGGEYRSVVRFRWRDAEGEIVRRAHRATRVCEIADDRPDLHVTKLRVRPGSTPGTRDYLVRVANRGHGDSGAFRVGLTVGGAAQPEQTLPDLAAGADRSVHFEAPRCQAGGEVVAVADSGGVVDEAQESDNARSQRC